MDYYLVAFSVLFGGLIGYLLGNHFGYEECWSELKELGLIEETEQHP